MISPDSRPVRSHAVAIVSAGDDRLLVRRSVAFKVNAVGLDIWNSLEGRDDLRSIADTIANRYAITRDEALIDVTAFVRELENRRLLG